MKRSFADYDPHSAAQAGTKAKFSNVGSSSSSYAIKFLFDDAEMRAVVLHGADIQQLSGATLSTTGELYPATAFQELNIAGPDAEAVLSAAIYTLTHIVQSEGGLTNGEGSVPDGECRLRTVVPTKAAAGIIGKGGSNIAQIRAATQLYVHVDKTMIPPDGGLLSEQVVSLSGPLAGLQSGLAMVLDHVHSMVGEHWFGAWALSTNVGMEIPGIALELTGKGMRGGRGEGDTSSPFGGKGSSIGSSGEICQHFARSGWCKHGDGCFHIHSGGPAQQDGGGRPSAHEILQALGLGGVPESSKGFSAVAPHQNAGVGSSGTICRFFASGQCKFGDSCKNLHVAGAAPNKSVSQEICMAFQRLGWCKWGDGCHHIHAGGLAAPTGKGR